MTVLLIELQLASLGLIALLATRRKVSPVLTISLFVSFLLWYVIPVSTTLIAPERLAGRQIVPPDVFARYAVIETVVFMVTVLWFLFSRQSIDVIENGALARLKFSRGVLTSIVLAGASLHVLVRWQLLSLVGSTYDAFNSFNVVGEAPAGVAGILIVLDGLLPAVAASCAITPMRGVRFVRIMIWLWVLWATFDGVRVGERLSLLTPCVLLLMLLHERRPSRAVIAGTYGAVIAFVATIGMLLTLVIANVRGGEAITFTAVGEEAGTIMAQRSSFPDRLWEFFDHLNIKFDSISAGAYLVEHNGSGVAGVKPYEGALLAVVPRQLYASKPVPRSADGTNLGEPSRIVARATGYYDEMTGNVGISPAAIAIWQFGFLGLIPLVILNYLNLRVVNSLLLRRSLITRALALFLITIPTFTGVFSAADLLIMNLERVIAVYAIATLLLAAGAQFGSRMAPELLPTR